MRELLLGIDIGTSACKVAAFDHAGHAVAQASAGYSVSYPRPGWAEQDPVQWWHAVCRSLHTLWQEGVHPAEIRAVGIDGQSWSAVAVDRAGHALCPTPIWMDTRAQAICREMEAVCGKEQLFSVSGNPVQPMYTMPKVLWYREHLPEVYEKAEKILQSNGYIACCLTGVMTQDRSQGYGWNCYRMSDGTWETSICQALDIRSTLLPELADCHQIIGAVTVAAAEQTDLLPGTPVAAGGLDAACGTLGVGVIAPGQTQEQGGQAGGMSICTDHPAADPRLILSAHVVPGLWLLQGGTVAGSASLKWFEQEFAAAERSAAAVNGTSSFEELSREASEIPAGADGMIFLPYLAGERSPIWDAHAKGLFYGLDFSKTRSHFARAVMEGVAYALRHNLETAAGAGAAVASLHAMGGAANSTVWTQIKADVTGKPIHVPSADTATALGAAILAGVGTGFYRDFSHAVSETVRIRRTHYPNTDLSDVYDRRYAQYRNLYESLKSLMKEA